MTGVTGGTVDGRTLNRMVDALVSEPWYEREQFEAGSVGLAQLHHGEKDPNGHSFWLGSKAAGVVDGAIANRADLGWDDAELFERLREAPGRTLRQLEGPFVIACIDAARDRLLLAMDKIGCRPCYYTAENGLVFGSELAALLERLDDPTVDEQGISDLLLLGTMWGDTTLLSGVKALHPATYLEYRDGEVTRTRYWKPAYDAADPTDEYFYDLVRSFQDTMELTAESVRGDAGIWLSGGLDSRMTLNELEENLSWNGRCGSGAGARGPDSLVALTYDANPGGGINPEIASDVAAVLGVDIEEVPLTPGRFVDILEKGVDLTSGMVRWNSFLNLTATFNVQDHDPDVVMEGLEGALVGHHLCRHHFTEPSSLVESMYWSEAALDRETVEELLAVDVDPLGSLRAEARRIDEPTLAEGVVDVHFQNYYSRVAHASNHVARSQVGTRVPYADGQFLKHVARLPLDYRMGALPFSDGELIYGVVEPKIRMVRALDDRLADIPYERSSVKPTRPFPLHVAGFFGSTALAQLRSKPTYGGTSLPGLWYRNHDELRETIDGYVDDACDRGLFDADAIRERQRRHHEGESDETAALASVTTAEIWLQRHLD